MLGNEQPADEKTQAELFAAVATTFTESLMTLARLIVAHDTPPEVKDGASKAYEAVYKRMVLELHPDMGEMRGVTKH